MAKTDKKSPPAPAPVKPATAADPCRACGSTDPGEPLSSTTQPIGEEVHTWAKSMCACGQVNVRKSVRKA